MQLALDTGSWDIYLDPTGNIATLGIDTPARSADLVCQRIRHRLQTFMGECFLDRSVGLPYYTEVLKKNPDMRRVRALILATISNVEDVRKIVDLKVDFLARSREYKVIFRAEATDGTIVEGSI